MNLTKNYDADSIVFTIVNIDTVLLLHSGITEKKSETLMKPFIRNVNIKGLL